MPRPGSPKRCPRTNAGRQARIQVIPTVITNYLFYNPVTQRAQSKLAQLGFDPGTTDGIFGRHTIAAIKAFQKKSGLPETGALDSATQAKLAIGAPAHQVAQVAQAAQVAPAPQVAQVTTVIDWRPVPTQDELDTLVANPANDFNFPYNDYRPGAPAANLDLPGAAILAAMNNSADTYGSLSRPGSPSIRAKAISI